MEPSQLLQIAFAGGIDESQRPEVLDPAASFTTIENCRQEARGGFTKRLGFAALASTRIDATSRSAGHRLATLGDSIVTIDGSVLDTWSPANSTWSQRGRVSPCTAKRRRLASVTGTAYETYDITYAGGFYIAVYRDDLSTTTKAVNAVVVDATSLTVVHAAQVASTSNAVDNIKVVAVGTNVIAVWSDGSNLRGSRLSTAALNSGWASSVSLAADYNASAPFVDACGLTTRFAIAYANNLGGSNRLSFATFDATVNALTQIQATNTNTSSQDPSGVGIDGDEADTLWIAYGRTALGVVCMGVNPTSITSTTVIGGSVVTMPSTNPFRIVVGNAGSTTCYVAATAVDATVSTFGVSKSVKVYSNAGSAGAVANTTNSLWGWLPASRPFVQGGRAYMEVYYQDDAIRTQALVDITSATGTVRPVAWVAPRMHDYTPDGSVVPRHTVAVSATKRVSIAAIRSSAVTSSLVAVEYDFGASTRWLPQAFASSLYLSGGMPYVYDGQRVREAGFVVAPRIDTTLTGTGLTGTHNYTAIYEYSDSQGNVIWSAPAIVSTRSPSNQTVRIRVRTCSVTWMDGTDTAPLEPRDLRRIRIKIYRTPNGVSGPFYLLTTIVNDPTASVVSYDDTTADSILTQRAQLYTAPGNPGVALDREALPSAAHMVECNGTLVMIADDGVTLYTVAQRVIGEAPWTNDEFTVPIEEDGDVMALAALDGTVFAFKRRTIFGVSVEAPTDNFSAGGFGAPRRLASDVGCIDPRSVVVTSLGIFFQSERGIELLNRGQAVEFIGEAVQATLASYPIVSAATLDARNSLVRFSLAASEADGLVSGNGVDIVFDLTLKAWVSRDTHPSNAPAASSAMVLLGGKWRYAWLSAAGVVNYEKLSSDATAYLDGTSTWITMLVETAWFKASGIQGRQHLNKALILAKRASAHGLSASIAYDYNTTYQAPQAWSESSVTTVASALPNEQLVHMGHDESPTQAVRLKLSDTAPVTPGTGQGATWLALTLDITPMQGAYALPEMAA